MCRLKIAVCGGGIIGLTFAIAISKFPDIEVDIYEATTQFTSFSAGIGIWPRVWQILCTLGLENALAKIATSPPIPITESMPSITLRKSDQSDGYEFHTVMSQGQLLTFHRAELQRVLLEHLPPSCHIHYSRRLQSYVQCQHMDGHIHLQFLDGITASCDILLGADGVRSITRSCMFRELAHTASREGRTEDAEELLDVIEPSWTGSIAYRAVIPFGDVVSVSDKIRIHSHPVQYMGKNANIFVYPLSGTDSGFFNIVVFHTRPELEHTKYEGAWSADSQEGELYNISPFGKWEPEAEAWIQSVVRWSKWAIHSVKTLPTFFSGRVALLGDAAHGMAPHQGVGAGEGIEDAFILAELLGHPTTRRSNISSVLEVYDRVRRPVVSKISQTSLEYGRYYSLNYCQYNFESAMPQEAMSKLKELGTQISRGWSFAWETGIDETLEDAIRQLEEMEDEGVYV